VLSLLVFLAFPAKPPANYDKTNEPVADQELEVLVVDAGSTDWE